MRPLPPVTPLPLQPGPQFPRVRRDDPLSIHIRDKSDPHHVRDRLVDINVLRKNEDGSYSPYLPAKADLVNGKVPESQLPAGGQGVTEVLVDGESVVSDGTASISLAGKVDKEAGKGLSSNDYTTEEKQKLSGVEAGAQKNVGEEYTAVEKIKLAGIEAGAQKNTVASVNTKTGAVSLSASDVGALSKAEAKSGFTEWEAVSVAPGYAFVSCEWDGDNDPPGWAVTTAIPGGLSVQELVPGTAGDISVETSFLTLSRAKLHPTKTSELENDSGFLTAHQSWSDVLPNGGVPRSDLASDVQTSLGKADTALQTAPVVSVNRKTGAVALTASDVGAAPAADIRYVLPAEPLESDPETGKYALEDRTTNWIITDSTSVTVVLPPSISGRLRDFELYVTSGSSGTGNVSLTCEAYDASEVITIGNGAGAVPGIPLGGDTVLYFSEVKEGSFILKGEEFVMITQGGN